MKTYCFHYGIPGVLTFGPMYHEVSAPTEDEATNLAKAALPKNAFFYNCLITYPDAGERWFTKK